jgi:predicted Zn-dependent protease
MIRRLSAALLAISMLLTSTPALAQTRADTRAAQQRAELLESFGGAFDGPVAAYVRRVGDRVAAAAGKPGSASSRS